MKAVPLGEHQQFHFPVVKEETCSLDPSTDFRLSFLRARARSLRFFFLAFFLYGKFSHSILRKSPLKGLLIAYNNSESLMLSRYGFRAGVRGGSN